MLLLRIHKKYLQFEKDMEHECNRLYWECVGHGQCWKNEVELFWHLCCWGSLKKMRTGRCSHRTHFSQLEEGNSCVKNCFLLNSISSLSLKTMSPCCSHSVHGLETTLPHHLAFYILSDCSKLTPAFNSSSNDHASMRPSITNSVNKLKL